MAGIPAVDVVAVAVVFSGEAGEEEEEEEDQTTSHSLNSSSSLFRNSGVGG